MVISDGAPVMILHYHKLSDYLETNLKNVLIDTEKVKHRIVARYRS